MRSSVLGLILVASTATAQSPTVASDSATAAQLSRLPNPATATWVSVAFTVAPIAIGIAASSSSGTAAGLGGLIGFAGAIVGPSTGYWYGHVGAAWPGMLLRTAGIVLVAAGTEACTLQVLNDATTRTTCSGGATAFVVAGSVLFLGSTVYDIAMVGRKVRAHNHTERRAMIVPLISPSERRVGVGVVAGW